MFLLDVFSDLLYGINVVAGLLECLNALTNVLAIGVLIQLLLDHLR